MAILIVGNVATTAVYSASDPSDQSPEFCDITGQELLPVIDGTWTLQQGAGVAAVAGLTIPLPPSSTSVTFEYDAGSGLMDVKSADLQDGMIMFPIVEQLVEISNEMMAEADVATVTGNCDWNEIPIIVGTNFYQLTETVAASAEVLQNLCVAPRWTNPEPGSYYAQPAQREWFEDNCLQFDHLLDGELKMTIMLKFSSSNAGSGYVVFNGEHEQYLYTAAAPVSVSR